MEGLLKVIEDWLGEIVTMFVFSSIGFIVYMLAPNNDSLLRRIRMAFLGFFISMGASMPIWLAIGKDKWWSLALIASVLTISGQFIPELIQSTLKKYATNKANKFTGDDN